MIRGYVCLGFQLINVIMNDRNQVKKLNVLFKCKQKRNERLQDIFLNDIFWFGMLKPY